MQFKPSCIKNLIINYILLVHYQCIIHGDLKPANLLLGENGRIIIADLGVCDDISECNDDKLEFSRGTPAFRSPESLQKDTRGFSGKVKYTNFFYVFYLGNLNYIIDPVFFRLLIFGPSV